MALFTVVVEETVRTAYTVEADSPEQARETWDRETDECGPIDWSVGKSSRVLSVDDATLPCTKDALLQGEPCNCNECIANYRGE